MKDKASAPVTVYAPSRPASIKTEPPAVPVPPATQATDMPTSSSAAESSNVPETDGYNDFILLIFQLINFSVALCSGFHSFYASVQLMDFPYM